MIARSPKNSSFRNYRHALLLMARVMLTLYIIAEINGFHQSFKTKLLEVCMHKSGLIPFHSCMKLPQHFKLCYVTRNIRPGYVCC
jgi:hypothetical protein